MDRGTLTSIMELKAGDRFYRAKDKKKHVFTMIEHEKKVTYYRTYRFWAQQDGFLHPQSFNGTTEVVFLRHKEL